MLTAKRVLIATICGFIFGLFCMYLASSNPDAAAPTSTSTKWLIILSRTMLGFTIGISALRLTWWLHGIVLGLICSIPMAIPVLYDSGTAMYSFSDSLILAAALQADCRILYSEDLHHEQPIKSLTILNPFL